MPAFSPAVSILALDFSMNCNPPFDLNVPFNFLNDPLVEATSKLPKSKDLAFEPLTTLKVALGVSPTILAPKSKASPIANCLILALKNDPPFLISTSKELACFDCLGNARSKIDALGVFIISSSPPKSKNPTFAPKGITLVS